MLLFIFAATLSALCQPTRPIASVRASTIDTVASHAASAIRQGRAHVEPNFLSSEELEAARADMTGMMAQIITGDAFESIQTDLLDPQFRRTLPWPPPLCSVLEGLDELRVALARTSDRSLLEAGGLHLMFYPAGGSGFMRHVDEDPSLGEPVRNSISLLLYLTPADWTEDDGGALCVYETAGGGGARPRLVLPVGGTLVVYDSTMEHEVLPTRRERHLVSGRFREMDKDWEARRQRGESSRR